MSASRDDDPTGTEFEKLIAATYRRVVAARQEYKKAQLRGKVSGHHIIQLAETASEYHAVLYEHRDEDVLEPEWDERDLDWLDDYLNETVTVEQDAPGMTSNTEEEEVPAILTVNPDRIINLTKELDTIRKELGFTARVTESNPRVELTDELIEGVEKWRKQKLED